MKLISKKFFISLIFSTLCCISVAALSAGKLLSKQEVLQSLQSMHQSLQKQQQQIVELQKQYPKLKQVAAKMTEALTKSAQLINNVSNTKRATVHPDILRNQKGLIAQNAGQILSMKIQMQMSAISEMETNVSNIMQAMHETNASIIINMR